jgi:hypothetical protein
MPMGTLTDSNPYMTRDGRLRDYRWKAGRGLPPGVFCMRQVSRRADPAQRCRQIEPNSFGFCRR